MPELNPYAPPRARPEARARWGPSGPIRIALRAAAVVWGFTILAGPARPAPHMAMEGGQPLAKAFGAILIVAAFFPLGERKMARLGEAGAEEL